MIVDLVRNDLSKVANKKSVTVDELCEVYTFENIHQMISKVSRDKYIIFSTKALFPMGSMTGVPKIKAMELMEKYKNSKEDFILGLLE